MRCTKWFCIILGVLLIIFTILPAPFGLVLQSAVTGGTQSKMHQLIDDGSLTVNAGELASNHGKDHGGRSTFEYPEDAKTAAMLVVAWSAANSIAGFGLAVSVGQFVMGVLWISVGIRIPSRLPAAPQAAA